MSFTLDKIKRIELWDNCPKVDELRENFRKVNFQERKTSQLPKIFTKIKATRKKIKKLIIGNELLVLISLVDLAKQFDSSYTVSFSTLSKKCGLPISEVIRHLQSLQTKAVITIKKQIIDQTDQENPKNIKNQKSPTNGQELYQIELVESSAIYEPISVRFYQSKRGKQYV